MWCSFFRYFLGKIIIKRGVARAIHYSHILHTIHPPRAVFAGGIFEWAIFHSIWILLECCNIAAAPLKPHCLLKCLFFYLGVFHVWNHFRGFFTLLPKSRQIPSAKNLKWSLLNIEFAVRDFFLNPVRISVKIIQLCRKGLSSFLQEKLCCRDEWHDYYICHMHWIRTVRLSW